MTSYELLGVAPNATPEEIRIAFKRMAAKWHPDRPGGDAEMFARVRRAYAALSRPVCSTCGGTGRVETRIRSTIRRSNCPSCWKGQSGVIHASDQDS